MRFITRQEELILLAIFRLKETAYLVTIREHLIQYTGKDWTVGALYVPLDRLRRDGYLDTYIGEATAVRGRNAIKYYRLTNKASAALADIKKVHDVMWEGYAKIKETAKNE
ncbi:PadR family transcriptional regulator [candidate division KSB1 bacterium]